MGIPEFSMSGSHLYLEFCFGYLEAILSLEYLVLVISNFHTSKGIISRLHESKPYLLRV